MQVRFWGTRGSIAKPGPTTLRYGGNTSCVEVRSASGTIVILDCGTGLQNLGEHFIKNGPTPVCAHILISHTHWDHIQGVPFFRPFFIKENEWDIYAPRGLGQSLRNVLAGQMEYTYFPITLEAMAATIRYHDLKEGEFSVGDIKVRAQYMNHTALTLGYRLEVDGVAMVYASDHEPFSREFIFNADKPSEQDQHHMDFLRDADLVIHDAQYTAAEYDEKSGWGHSPFECAVAMCRMAGVKQLALTHHDPMRDDVGIDEIQDAARDQLSKFDTGLDVFAAEEGVLHELTTDDVASDSISREVKSEMAGSDAALVENTILLGTVDRELTGLVSDIAGTDGISLVVKRDAVAFMQTAIANPASIILLDDQLVTGSGTDVEQAILKLDKFVDKDVPLVVISDTREDIGQGRERINDWLIRPFTPQYARTKIQSWLMRNSARWVRAPIPKNEKARLESLRQLEILDTQPEEKFDRITRIAAAIFDVPIVLVSLVDLDRQWFKSCYGLEAKETSREVSFCAHALLETNVMIVPDALDDDRFAENPLVTDDPRIRFYAGYPLALRDGNRVGTLCLIDVRPRDLNAKQVGILSELGGMVENELSSQAN